MAKGEKVSKGFGFYLFLLILILVAAFMIIVTIMMFSPKKVILGYQYFFYNDEYAVTKVDEQDINFSDINKVVVNTQSASVSVLRSSNEKDGIYIRNIIMGFAKQSQNVNFEYTVTLEDKVLTVNLNEATGFLLFSRDIEVVIRLPMESTYNFSKTEFDITTTSGSVYIGNSSIEEEKKLDIDKLSINTRKGDVKLNDGIDGVFSGLSLSVGSGTFNTDIEDIKVNTTPKLTTTSGRFNFINLSSNKDVEANLNNGTLKVTTLTGGLSILIKSGKIQIESMAGDFSANETTEYINKSSITIGEIAGDVSLPSVKATNVEIGKIEGMLNIATTSGNVKIGEVSGLAQASWIQTVSGNITATITDSTEGIKHYFSSTSGNINLTFTNKVISQNSITSKTGSVTININSDNEFLLVLEDAEGKPYESVNEKLNLTFVDSKNYQYPFRVNNYAGDSRFIHIQTNGQINAYLLRLNP